METSESIDSHTLHGHKGWMHLGTSQLVTRLLTDRSELAAAMDADNLSLVDFGSGAVPSWRDQRITSGMFLLLGLTDHGDGR